METKKNFSRRKTHRTIQPKTKSQQKHNYAIRYLLQSRYKWKQPKYTPKQPTIILVTIDGVRLHEMIHGIDTTILHMQTDADQTFIQQHYAKQKHITPFLHNMIHNKEYNKKTKWIPMQHAKQHMPNMTYLADVYTLLSALCLC